MNFSFTHCKLYVCWRLCMCVWIFEYSVRFRFARVCFFLVDLFLLAIFLWVFIAWFSCLLDSIWLYNFEKWGRKKWEKCPTLHSNIDYRMRRVFIYSRSNEKPSTTYTTTTITMAAHTSKLYGKPKNMSLNNEMGAL